MIKEILKNELITIGRTGIINPEMKLSKWFPIRSSNAYQIFDIIKLVNLSNDELIDLFRGLVISEKVLSWHCGSTTPAAHYYQVIQNRNLDPDLSLADWAFQLSDNENIPFGFIRHGEKPAYEYIEWRENYHARVAKEQYDAIQRKERRNQRAKEIAALKRQQDESNQKIRNEIMRLTPEKQIKTIVEDKTRNLLFYTPVIKSLLQQSDVTRESWMLLLKTLLNKKITPFNKRLANAIMQKIHVDRLEN